MNYSPLATAIMLLLLTACRNPPAIEGTYAYHYTTLSDEDREVMDYGPGGYTVIWRFTEDSIHMHRFPDFTGYTTIDTSFSYTLTNDSLSIGDDDEQPCAYTFSGDSLYMYLTTYDRPRSEVLGRLQRFNQAPYLKEVEQLMTTATYELFDSVRLEFAPNHIVHTDEPAFVGWDHVYWELLTYENELFIVTGNTGSQLQVVAVSPSEITLLFYGRSARKLPLRRLKTYTAINTPNIVGTWKRINDPLDDPDAPPPVYDTSRPYYSSELLNITDTTLRSRIGGWEELWSMHKNPSGDILYLDRPGRRGHDWDRWSVQSVNDDQLVLKPTGPTNRWQREATAFARVKE